MKQETIRKLVENHRDKLGATLSILMDIQAIQGYLSRDTLQIVAEETGGSLVDIYGIVSSHPHFKLGPRTPGNIEHIEGIPSRESRPDVRCHYCNHTLLDPIWLIDGVPSIRVTTAFGLEHGWFRLSSRPDTCLFVSEYEFPNKGMADFFCPHCHSQLFSSVNCPECGAPMVPMLSRDAKLIPVCSNSRNCCRLGVRVKKRTVDRHDRESNESDQVSDTAVLMDAGNGS